MTLSKPIPNISAQLTCKIFKILIVHIQIGSPWDEIFLNTLSENWGIERLVLSIFHGVKLLTLPYPRKFWISSTRDRTSKEGEELRREWERGHLHHIKVSILKRSISISCLPDHLRVYYLMQSYTLSTPSSNPFRASLGRTASSLPNASSLICGLTN